MHKLLAIAAIPFIPFICLALMGCPAQLSTILGATVPGSTVKVAVSSFNAIETVATGYLDVCVASPALAAPRGTEKVLKAMRSWSVG